MNRRIVLVLVALVVGVSAPKADPPPDVELCVFEGAPGCDLDEGHTTVRNLSSTRHFRVEVTGAASLGQNALCFCDSCGGNCQSRPCSSSWQRVHELGPGASRNDYCFLPNGALFTPGPQPCRDCTGQGSGQCPAHYPCCVQNCDNRMVNGVCTPGLCVEILALAKVLAWSNDGVDWNDYSTPVPIPASCFSHSSVCEP